jgi:hypothetical protein
VVTLLVSFRSSEVANSYLAIKTGPCTYLGKVLATQLDSKVVGVFVTVRIASLRYRDGPTYSLVSRILNKIDYLSCSAHIFVMKHPLIHYGRFALLTEYSTVFYFY